MRSDLVFLQHILDEIDLLLKETANQSFEDFIRDEISKRAYSRCLEIIGEAVKNLSPGLKRRYKETEWKRISGLRDKIIHQYFGVNYDILWDIIKNKLPGLRRLVNRIVNEMEQKK